MPAMHRIDRIRHQSGRRACAIFRFSSRPPRRGPLRDVWVCGAGAVRRGWVEAIARVGRKGVGWMEGGWGMEGWSVVRRLAPWGGLGGFAGGLLGVCWGGIWLVRVRLTRIQLTPRPLAMTDPFDPSIIRLTLPRTTRIPRDNQAVARPSKHPHHPKLSPTQCLPPTPSMACAMWKSLNTVLENNQAFTAQHFRTMDLAAS